MGYIYFIVAYLIVINGIGMYLMYADKKRARQRRWRMKERTLFSVALIGGSIGVLLGSKCFRHKTKHPTFTYGIPFIILLQIILVTFLLYDVRENLFSLMNFIIRI